MDPPEDSAPPFSTFLNEVIDKINTALRDGNISMRPSHNSKGRVSIGLYCRKGKHRSTGEGELLAFLFKATGYQVILYHTCRQAWNTQDCADGTCTACNYLEPNFLARLQEIRDTALGYWDAISLTSRTFSWPAHLLSVPAPAPAPAPAGRFNYTDARLASQDTDADSGTRD